MADPPDCFESVGAFETYLKFEGNDDVAMWAATAWDHGYRSIESVAQANEAVLRAAHGEGISAFHSFCKARAGAAFSKSCCGDHPLHLCFCCC